MMRTLAIVFTLVSIIWSAPVFAVSCPAESLIQNASADFVRAAKSGSPAAFANATARYTDMRAIAMFALGSHRKDLPPGREAEYVALTKKWMGAFMAEYADQLGGSGLKITNCSENLVMAKLSNGQAVTFRIRGNRRIEDVNVSGIWLIQTMKLKFANVINYNGGDVNALLDYLKK